jgi:hypothetical protein
MGYDLFGYDYDGQAHGKAIEAYGDALGPMESVGSGLRFPG